MAQTTQRMWQRVPHPSGSGKTGSNNRPFLCRTLIYVKLMLRYFINWTARFFKGKSD
jgi:hypothetical protein